MHTEFAKNMVLIQRIRSEWKIPMRLVCKSYTVHSFTRCTFALWTNLIFRLPISTPGTVHRTQLVMNPIIYVTLSIKMPYSVFDRYRWCRCVLFFVCFTVIVYEFKESFRVFALCTFVCVEESSRVGSPNPFDENDSIRFSPFSTAKNHFHLMYAPNNWPQRI